MESRTALIVGATGLVGGHCLEHLLSEDAYERVVVLGRRTTGLDHPKLEEVITDFEQLADVRDRIRGDDVYLCLGTTRAKAGSRNRFRQVDYGYPLMVATAAQLNGARQLLLVSSVGASPRSSAFYLQVKGELEAAITVLPVRSHHVFRPSMLLGARAERRRGEALGGQLGRAFSFAMVGNFRRYRPIAATSVAKAMVTAALMDEPGQHIYKHDDIVRLAGAR